MAYDSWILDKVLVSAIGLRRSTEQQGLHFGITHTLDTFHISWKSQQENDSLNMCVRGPAKYFATSLIIFVLGSKGPTALFT